MLRTTRRRLLTSVRREAINYIRFGSRVLFVWNFVVGSQIETEYIVRGCTLHSAGRGTREAIRQKVISPDAGERASDHDVREARCHARP
jgi:hypothetical protein